MKRTLALILTLALLLTTLLGAVPMTVSAADPIVYNEKEPNNSNSSPDNIAPNYLVKGKTTNSDTDKFCFTIDETATVTYSGEADHLDLYTCLYDLTTGTLKTAFPQAHTMRFSGTKLLKPGTYYLQMSVQSAVTAARTINYSFLLTVEKHEHVYDDNCDTQCNDTACNATRTAPHNFADRNDTTCSCGKVCKAHTFDNACDADCNLCGGVFATAGHDFSPATCTAPKTCKICKATEGTKLGHSFNKATCSTPKTCKVCSATEGKPLSHAFNKATCSTPKTCKVCGATEGKPLNHSYDNNCDAACNLCNAARAVSHNYKTVINKATAAANGYTVQQCSVCKMQVGKTTINKIKSVTLSATSYTYDGKAKSPSVVVKDAAGKTLKKNTDYTVTYAKGRKNVGAYKVTVTFKGNYSGKKVLTFKINPPATKVSKLAAEKKSLKVTIGKKTTQVTGYEVQYSTSKSFKSAKTKVIKKAKTTSLTIKSLKAKKTYYVRVRTYKTVGGKKYYSAWSAVKSKKTK